MGSEQKEKPSPLATWEKLLLGVPLRRAPALLPGIGLALAVTLLADRLSVGIGWLALRFQGINPHGRPSPISAMTCSVLLGLTLGNSIGLHRILRPGVDFTVKKILRLGIILVGIRLSLLDVVHLGFWGIPVVFLLIVSALFLTNWISNWLGLSARLGALAAASTAICGVTAAVAVAPLIDADEQELAYTVANVTIFGMLAMLTYPYLAHFLFGHQSGSIGLFLGTAIHDTSQVMGAALAYRDVFGDEIALKIATVTKLTRNVFLAAVVPALTFHFARKGNGERKQVNITNLLPLFVLGFLVMAILRSAGDAGVMGARHAAYGVWAAPVWSRITRTLGDTVSTVALGAAMAGVGLSTNLRALRRLGVRPLYLGAAAATIVSGVGLMLAAVVGPRIHIREASPAPAAAPRSPVPAGATPAAPAMPVPQPMAARPDEEAGPAEIAAAVPGVDPVTAPATAPVTDTDSDGIADAKDACVSFAGPVRNDPAKMGCPTVRVDDGQIILLDQIRFRRHKASIPRAAKPSLIAVLQVLRNHDEIKSVAVNGRANEWRSHRRNVQLGRRRAVAVAHWLNAHQAVHHRVRFKGFAGRPPSAAASEGRDVPTIEIRIRNR